MEGVKGGGERRGGGTGVLSEDVLPEGKHVGQVSLQAVRGEQHPLFVAERGGVV